MRKDDKYIQMFERSQRNLPHFEAVGATYFVRFSLVKPPIVDLSAPSVAEVMVSALAYHDGSRYWLYDYTVMPDHVHAILQPVVVGGQCERITSILYSLKGWTAKQINAQLGRRGELWQQEGYDHIVRNREDYEEKALYIYMNPVKAGLTTDPADWPWWGQGSGCRL